MKKGSFLLSLFGMILMFLTETSGQEKKQNYGRTPDEMIPFGRFQKAYMNFFDTPQEFTGAGREKPEPKNLKSVKIGLLGPLEGSVLTPQGIQMMQGALLAIEENPISRKVLMDYYFNID